MLKTRKPRVYTYRVLYRHDENFYDEYIQALSAQNAVDMTRKHIAPEGAEIVEVAKVVNNWK